MSTKILISTLGIALMPFLAFGQNSKFALAVQTTTIESPIPFGNFTDYEINSQRGARNDYSIEILGRVFLNENVAIRLRTGITNYHFEDTFLKFSELSGRFATGIFQKYALGIESRRILGNHLAIRFGCDLQIGFFKDMISKVIGDFPVLTKKYDTNTALNLAPLMAADWFIWRGLSLSAELRLPFERAYYNDKGVFIEPINVGQTFDNDTYKHIGFSKPICSFQIGYCF